MYDKLSRHYCTQTVDSVMATISPFNLTVSAGETFSFICSVNVTSQSHMFTLEFNWFFGPMNNSLPVGVTVSPTTSNGSVYSSMLLFSPVYGFHEGTYTCQVGSKPSFAANTQLSVMVNPGKQREREREREREKERER